MTIPARACPWLAALSALGALGIAAGLALGAPDSADALFLAGVVLPVYATGMLAWRRRPDLPIARLLLAAGGLLLGAEGVVGVLQGIYEQAGAHPAAVPFLSLGLALHVTGVVLGSTVIGLFPSGLARRRYERLVVRAMWVFPAAVVLQLLTSPRLPVIVEGEGPLEVTTNPLAIAALAGLADVPDALVHAYGLAFAAGAVLLALRYRRLDGTERLQVRWLLLVALGGLILAQALWALPGVPDAAGILVASLTLVLLPVTVLVAILRYRLLDVDLLIRRSLVYGLLWLLIVGAYVGGAAVLGIAASGELPVSAAILITIVATLAFQPARRRLETLADRWVFGERLGGYELLTRFGATLEETFDPDELFARLAETVRRGLRVRWARVLVRRPAGSGYVLDPQAGAGIDPTAKAAASAAAPLVHAGEALGLIEVGPSVSGELSDEDRALLETLARQAALAIRNARLASELSVRLEEIRDQAEQLRASRKRIVHAQDSERRRIERNIHDGVQQELVALIAKLRLARNRLAREAEPPDGTLAELQVEAAGVLADLRELAQGIHPSVLSDRGLVDAIEARAARMPVAVTVRADAVIRATRFEAEAEAAAYFVVSEALANALKHSGAGRVEVTLAYDGAQLELEVCDDGHGFERSTVTGSGLGNMDDRIEALGGRLTVGSSPGSGTRIAARLPAAVGEGVHV